MNRKAVRERLASELESAIRNVLTNKELQVKSAESPPFHAREPVDGRGRFKPSDEPIGIRERGGLRSELREIYLSSHSASWFRLTPVFDPGRIWSVEELEKANRATILLPLSRNWRGWDFFHTPEGFGVYSFLSLAVISGVRCRHLVSCECSWRRKVAKVA